jgi:hypothetical protein
MFAVLQKTEKMQTLTTFIDKLQRFGNFLVFVMVTIFFFLNSNDLHIIIRWT